MKTRTILLRIVLLDADVTFLFFLDNWKLLYYLIVEIIPGENFSPATSGLRSRGSLLYKENNMFRGRI